MFLSEKSALGRTLVIMKEVYAAVCENALLINVPAALDGLSAALSHVEDEKEPLAKMMGKLKREMKAKNKNLYPKISIYFKRVYACPEFDYEKAKKHIPAIIHGNDLICGKIVNGESEKVKSMCEAMKSYPGFLFGEFSSLSDEQFFDLVFGYYPKFYEEEFMEKMKQLFM